MNWDWGNIVVAIAIGTVIPSLLTLLTHFLMAKENKKHRDFDAEQKKEERNFNRKESIYLGLLEAYFSLPGATNLQEAQNKGGRFQFLIELVGSPAVVKALRFLIATTPNSPERFEADKALKQAMREDLDVDARKIDL